VHLTTVLCGLAKERDGLTLINPAAASRRSRQAAVSTSVATESGSLFDKWANQKPLLHPCLPERQPTLLQHNHRH